jgi:hypothetical protein
MIKQYVKNKKVFNNMMDLQHYPLTYYSVLKQCDIKECDVMRQVEIGDVIVLKGLIGKLNLQEQVDSLSKDFFNVNYQQLEDIHNIKSIKDIVDRALLVRDALPTLILQSSIMQRILRPHTDKIFLELQPNMRLHLPYEKIKKHEAYIEAKMGRGKLNPHGQHKDSWRYHPKNTLNVWVAFSEVTEKNGMSLLPQSTNYYPKFDPVKQEIAVGVKTYPSLQHITDMQPGDALLFQADLLHGSIINTSNKTRVALSMRCTTSEPEFHKRVTYNYIKVENGKFDNLSKNKFKASGQFEPLSKDSSFAPMEKKNTSIIPVMYDKNHITIKIHNEIRSFPRKCPHAGTDLLYGELNEKGELICPSHRMCFSGKICSNAVDI